MTAALKIAATTETIDLRTEQLLDQVKKLVERKLGTEWTVEGTASDGRKACKPAGARAAKGQAILAARAANSELTSKQIAQLVGSSGGRVGEVYKAAGIVEARANAATEAPAAEAPAPTRRRSRKPTTVTDAASAEMLIRAEADG